MAQVTFKGSPITIKGNVPEVNQKATDFTIVADNLNETKLSDYGQKIKVLIAVPSLDTSVCATETRNFSKKLAEKPDVVGVVISKDLPFAMKRYLETNQIENIKVGSDFRYNDFCSKYGTEITEGPLKGLSARAVFVVDKDNNIRYSELVPEIASEPEYDKAMEVINKLL